MRTKAVFLAIVFLVGCAAKAPKSTMKNVQNLAPGTWSSTKQAKRGVDSNWVARFGDQRLSSLVRQAISSNYDMHIAAERVFQAAVAAKVSDALAKPQVSFATNAQRKKNIFIGFPFGGSSTTETFGTNLGVDWELDLWGRLRAGKSASIARWQAGTQDYRAARASLAGQICKVWFAIAEANEQVSLAQNALATRRKIESSVSERYRSNMLMEGGSAAQLRLAQMDVATARADLIARKGELLSARRQLELLLGKYPSGKLTGRSRLPSLKSVAPSGLPSELLLRRPDILSAERQYAATIQSIKEAKLAAFPSISLTGSAGTTASSIGDILKSDFGVWSLGAGIVQPILTGGRILSTYRVRKSEKRQALATLQKTVLNSFLEVEQALDSERRITQRIAHLRSARNLAKEAADSAGADYREGNGDVLTLFNAQSRHIALESQLVSLRRLRLNNRVDLHLALGGDFLTNP